MVLESITNPSIATKRPWIQIIIGFAFATAAIFLSIWIFEEYASLVMVFLTVMGALPLFYTTMKKEEAKDSTIIGEKTLLKEHAHALRYLFYTFIGFSIAYTLWYILLPAGMSANLFKVQTQTIANLNQHVTGHAAKISLLNKIFLNNVKVMIFCVLFAFVYGSGAIFILSWNASVIGAAAGNFIRNHVAKYAESTGLAKIGVYFHGASLSVLRYSLHGIPEIMAYFVAGMAGGILSVAVIRKEYKKKQFEKILLDASDLILISVFILFVAALLEVFLTPIFF
ncbi:stage II sporulation protein M [Candidatus Woesearchaeota archaeon]|nr:stage II sporulation protein M [Candidatus Woesearchaeota archaeon]